MNEDPKQREDALKRQIKLIARYKEKLNNIETTIGDLHQELKEDMEKFKDHIKNQLDEILREDV